MNTDNVVSLKEFAELKRQREKKEALARAKSNLLKAASKLEW